MSVATDIQGIHFLNLRTLVELKLASGMSGAGRLRDLADVQQLIGTLALSEDFAEQLHPDVRDKFREQWRDIEDAVEEP